jgi:hypothetical protein
LQAVVDGFEYLRIGNGIHGKVSCGRNNVKETRQACWAAARVERAVTAQTSSTVPRCEESAFRSGAVARGAP